MEYQDGFWEVQMTGLMLTTSPVKCQLVYINMGLASYILYTWSIQSDTYYFPLSPIVSEILLYLKLNNLYKYFHKKSGLFLPSHPPLVQMTTSHKDCCYLLQLFPCPPQIILSLILFIFSSLLVFLWPFWVPLNGLSGDTIIMLAAMWSPLF